jgi:hypothetical protein
MTYWLDLFTGRTWKEFRESGCNVSGFREPRRNYLKRIKTGDILLCYLTGVMRWVGALRVIGPSNDSRKIWSEAEFPIRFDVEPVIVLDPEEGIPMDSFEGKLAFYSESSDRGKFQGFLRGSPNQFKKDSDGTLIWEALQKAKQNPIRLPVDEKKLNKVYRAETKAGGKKVTATVSVPEKESVIVDELAHATPEASIHTHIQYLLLWLGGQMGLSTWVARNDRSRTYKGKALGELPGIIDKLPTQFNEVTNRTIELIDVLWLRSNSIIAAFEVESTTSVYSGLLRMSDLLALQPNLNINLFLVAPDDRRNKVEQEILRPTFALREKPLNKLCGFVAFSKLIEKVQIIENHGLAGSLKPDFIEQMAEYFTPDE